MKHRLLVKLYVICSNFIQRCFTDSGQSCVCLRASEGILRSVVNQPESNHSKTLPNTNGLHRSYDILHIHHIPTPTRRQTWTTETSEIVWTCMTRLSFLHVCCIRYSALSVSRGPFFHTSQNDHAILSANYWVSFVNFKSDLYSRFLVKSHMQYRVMVYRHISTINCIKEYFQLATLSSALWNIMQATHSLLLTWINLGDGQIFSSHTFLGMWLLIHAKRHCWKCCFTWSYPVYGGSLSVLHEIWS